MNLGIHYMAEFYQCDRRVIDDIDFIEKKMLEAAELTGATVISPFFHKFSPQGVSGIIVIAESHFAIHTWPEYSFAAVDLFSCGNFDCLGAFNFLKKAMKCEKLQVSSVKRGILSRSDSVLEINNHNPEDFIIIN